jgi:dihydrofolate reductase
MSAKASVYIATSLDGFIAREDGGLDWLNTANSNVPKGEDCGYRAFMDTVDVLVMGRKSYEKVLSFENWPYGDTRVVVLSRNPIAFPKKIPKSVTHSSETPTELTGRLISEGMQHLYVDGGVTIQRFLAEGLINELTITIIPILLGSGIRLFGPLPKDIQLTHIATRSFDFGFVQKKYSIEKLHN